MSTTTRMLATAYDQHGAAVYGLAHRVTGDAEVAAALTAEVFAGLRWVGASGQHTLGSCLLTDVHRRAVAWTRSCERPAAMNAGLPLDDLALLDDDERAVLAEAYFGGKTYDEVAATLHITRADAARLMQQALHRLGSTSLASPRLTFKRQTI